MQKRAEMIFESADLVFTQHALERMGHRHISATDIENVINYGRSTNIRGAVIYVIGVKEVKMQKAYGIRLDHCEGIHVVCSNDNVVLTVYKNHDLRGLKPRSRRHWHEKGCSESRINFLDAA